MRGVFYLKKKDIWKIVFAVTITALFALLSSYFTDTSSEWYMALEKPSIQPPPIVFAIAWPIIYVLFAASFSVLLIKNKWSGAFLYIINLILTTLWCVLFFVRHSTGSALVLLLIIFAFAVYLAIFAYNKSVLAGILILPYVLWIGYALAINYGVVLLN